MRVLFRLSGKFCYSPSNGCSNTFAERKRALEGSDERCQLSCLSSSTGKSTCRISTVGRRRSGLACIFVLASHRTGSVPLNVGLSTITCQTIATALKPSGFGLHLRLILPQCICDGENAYLRTRWRGCRPERLGGPV